MLDRLGQADEIDWERASLDPASVAAVGGDKRPAPRRIKVNGAPSAVIVVDRQGIPLAVIHSAANVHDSKALEVVVGTIEPIRRPRRGRPRKRPKKLHTDKGYDFLRCRRIGIYEALRANSFSMRSLSKPTIQLLPILITGTPVCPVLRTISRAASGSRSMFTSLNGTRCSLK
jgi:hypothetical protein